jgi:hypothetical protein
MSHDNANRSAMPSAGDVRECPKSSDPTSIRQNEPKSDVRKCPNPSDAKSIWQNEPKLDGARREAGSPCPEMSENVRDRPIPNPKAQNEATATTPPIDPALELSPRQLEAINLLFAGKSYGLVSTELGVAARTLYRWRQTPAFAAEVRRRYRERAVARKPQNRVGGLIPPAAASPVARAVSDDARRRENAYWDAIIRSGKPFPPAQPGEPLWVQVLRGKDVWASQRPSAARK